MSPMAFTSLLLLLLLGTGTCDILDTETTTETTTTDTTTTETTTTDTTTTETTIKITTALNFVSKNTSANRIPASISSHSLVFPTTSNTTNVQSSNSSAGNTTSNSTAVPVSDSTPTSHSNTTTNSTDGVPPFSANTTNSSSVAPTSPGVVMTVFSTKGKGSSSTQVIPTQDGPAQGSTAPRLTPTAVLGSGPNPSKTAALHPTAVQLLLRVPLSFRIINRSFNESLRNPTSKEYQSLQYTVLTMFERVFGCVNCMGRLTYKGCSELRFSQGSVEVQSTLVFGHGNGTVTSDAAERRLRNSLDPNGFIMDLQLASIQSAVEVMSPAPVPVVPDWAIALLVLVCILLLLSILTCLLMTTCTCRRKSQGKLDLLSTKDSYHPMAEYPPYQSHGRYVPPHSKPSPYSQVAGSNGAGTGTFTYTNPATASDNL